MIEADITTGMARTRANSCSVSIVAAPPGGPAGAAPPAPRGPHPNKPSSFSPSPLPPFPPKNDVRGCRAVTDPCCEGDPGPEAGQPRRIYCSGPSEALQDVPAGGEDRE